MQYLLGYDVGSSSIKASLLDASTGRQIVSASSPANELSIDSPEPGWAEQSPDTWWDHIIIATRQIITSFPGAAEHLIGIGISYQMHGLVIVDKDLKPLRPSIIWCDSRAVEIGQGAFSKLGEQYCLGNFYNSPGNFTASKLKWVRDNEPEIFSKVFKFMLPGDYIAMKLTGKACTTVSGLSEGILWNFKESDIAADLLSHFQIPGELVADIVPTFGHQGKVTMEAAKLLGISPGVPVTYRAGDQPNNAFSLKTLNPGEVAATAGTSGVIYGVLDKPVADQFSRINGFVHVNHRSEAPRVGLLLCINGTGIMNSWLRKLMSHSYVLFDYETMNSLAAQAPIGSDELMVFPFGNGAERIFEDQNIGASFKNIDLTRHSASHLCRAVQEGIVFSLAYGFEIFKSLGLDTTVIRAGKANMFLSETFCEAFANVTGVRLELYSTDGAQGAARGAGVGCGFYKEFDEAFHGLHCIGKYQPSPEIQNKFTVHYQAWKKELEKILQLQ